MPRLNATKNLLTDLLADLAVAVKQGDRAGAQRLEHEILKFIANTAIDCAAIELKMRALLAELNNSEDTLRDLDLDSLFVERGSDLEEKTYPVWFGTNRKPEGKGFGNQRHDQITLGRALVHVPEAHRFGETGSSLWRRLIRFDLRNDSLRLQALDTRESDTFFSEILAEMKIVQESGEIPHALVFLHGYNVSFEEAAIRAAQLGVDLKIPGVTAFFSWPSRGSAAAYPIDEASIEASESAITDFLVDFTENCGAQKVHIIAHSMGNRGFVRALQRVSANSETRGKVKFGQIFLAAPDIDSDLFIDLSHLYIEHAERVTLYASNADKAVHISSKLHDAPRAGYYDPYTVVKDVDTVAVPDFDVDLLGHSYFAKAEALLHDIYDLIRHGESPDLRQRLVAVEFENKRFWRFRR